MNAISVGVDVSKGRSTVTAMRPFGEVIFKPRNVAHTLGELGDLADLLKTLDGDVRVVMEATGRYYEPIAEALHNAGIFVSVVNPKLIKDYGNNSLRKVVTDKADARKLARYGLEYWNELRRYSTEDVTRKNLKDFSRQYDLYVKVKTALKNNLTALIDQTFPGVKSLFSSPAKANGQQKWVCFVTEFWHCDCVRKMDEPAFISKYADWCKQHRYHFSRKKAAEIYDVSLSCYAALPMNDATKLLIVESAAQLTNISRTVEIFRAELLRLASLLPEFPAVMKLYGAGDTTGPQLIAEIGDVRRFTSRKALVAFAGVDPGDDQSGNYQAKSVETSKRGSSQLRRVLFLAVSTYMKKSPANEPVYQFINKKRSEGKPFFVYMTAAANKFLRIYYARVNEYLDNRSEG